MNAPEGDGLEILDPSDCWRLLRTHSIGRLAANRPSLSPYIVPVNYAVEANLDVLIRTDAGAKLHLVAHDLLAVEVDEIDPVHHVGWSVVVEGIGRVHRATPADLEHETWAPGAKELVLRISPVSITGRRIRLETADTDERGYR